MSRLILLLSLCFSLSANAGFLYKDLEFLAMENFSVERKNDKVYIHFDYVIENPNFYGIILKPSSLKLKVADVDCGVVNTEEKIKIHRKKKGSYPFVLVGDGSSFVKSGFASLWYLISGKGVDFNLTGKLNAGVVLFTRKWPLDYTYKMTFEEFLSLF